ncbi:MAG: serine/threonine-protein phosphatase [Oscillochloris sp.]|nr:serine/threonine-protein phosphatase [Oscillochloris sp.]
MKRQAAQLLRHNIRASLLGHRGTAGRRRKPAPKINAPAAPEVSAAERQRTEELEQELELARDIQQGLLLEAAPHLSGWEITAVSLPARSLGGDLYDFLPLSAGAHGIMIGDVSGKGLPAALRMAVARTVFRHEARRNGPPADTLAAVNRGILSEIPQGMVTMLYARLDLTRGRLRLANAGHTFPMVINGQVSEIELSGLPLGVDDESDYNEDCIDLNPGDSVLLYTDGVLEAENASGEIFSYERLEALVAANNRLKPRALVARLLSELRTWSNGVQSDDITIVALRRRLDRLNSELFSVSEDVLGAERAAQLWSELEYLLANSPDTAGSEHWLAALPAIVKLVQTSFGRGLAREMNQQLRLVLEDYR